MDIFSVLLASDASQCGTSILVLFAIILMAIFMAFLSNAAKASLARRAEPLLDAIKPALMSKGFHEITASSGLFTICSWDGSYRNRDFIVRLERLRNDNFALRIFTSNKSGKQVNISFNNLEQMRQKGLEDIYLRLDKMGFYSDFTRYIPMPFENALDIDSNEAKFVLRKPHIDQQNVADSIEIFCDLLDRLDV